MSLLCLRPLRSLQAKYAVYDYMQAYRSPSGFHDQVHSRARQMDPSSIQTTDLGPGKGISFGFTREKQTQLAPSTATSVEDLGKDHVGLIHPGLSNSLSPEAATRHLDTSTNRWTSTMPTLPNPSLNSLGKPIPTFNFPNARGQEVDRGMHKLTPPPPVNAETTQPQTPGFLQSVLQTSRPVNEAMNLWHYLTD